MQSFGSTGAVGIREGVVVQPKNFITPTIKVNSGATTSSGCEVVIDPNNGTAGLKHIEDATPTEAEVYDELVAFEFNTSDKVRTVYLTLTTYDDGATANGLCPASHLVFTLNGDISADATKLLNGHADVGRVYPGETVAIRTAGYITRIATIAKRRQGAANGQDTYDGLISLEAYGDE